MFGGAVRSALPTTFLLLLLYILVRFPLTIVVGKQAAYNSKHVLINRNGRILPAKKKKWRSGANVCL